MKAIGLREFLRGAYRDLDEMTVVTRHGHPIGTWIPQQQRKNVALVTPPQPRSGVDLTGYGEESSSR